jgi:hypothetical protein
VNRSQKYKKFNDSSCQWRHSNSYCPECKATGHSAHKKGCSGQKVKISPTARFPKNGANKKIWARFYDKFVLLCDWKEYIKNK